MANRISARLSFDDVTASVKRARKEGEKLVGRLQKDARAFVGKRPLELLDDARKSARRVAKELDAQRTQLSKTLGERLLAVADDVRKRFGAASVHDVDVLARRVAELERRVDAVTKKAGPAAA
jgi:polyhydroxyalkanoate synthesis regulator phasin